MKRKIFRIALTVSLMMIVIEITLRIVGIRAYNIPHIQIESTPKNSILPDKQFGFILNDGKFSVVLNKGLKFTVTHVNGMRITKIKQNNLTSTKPSIAFLGCSFTYGYGISDQQTFPYLVQQKLENYDVLNFAIPGTGTIHSLLTLEEKIRKNDLPDIVILCFADFHLERDLLSESYQEKLSIGFEQNPFIEQNKNFQCEFPYGQIKNEQLIISHKNSKDFVNVSWIRRNISLINQTTELFRSRPTYEVTLAAIDKINKLCKENNSKFVLACLTGALPVKEYAKQKNISCWNISVPIQEKGLNLLPYDPHPSPLAASKYADAILLNLNKEFNIN
jgi:hypothetical protein